MIKRYWYIVWKTPGNDYELADVFDMTPAEWLIRNNRKLAVVDTLVIVNQFEISAEEYTRLESLQ